MAALIAIASLLFSSLAYSPMITEGCFANGIRYYVAANGAEKGYADFLVVQQNCDEGRNSSRGMLDRLENTYPTDFLCPKGVGYSEYGFISYPSDSTRVFGFHQVPVSVKSDLDSTLLVMRDIMAEHEYPQAVIVCGDVDKGRVVSVLETLCLTLKPQNEGGSPLEIPETSEDAQPGEIVIPLTLERTSRENMNTIIPYVSELMVQQVGFIVEERLYRSFRERKIPHVFSLHNDAIHIRVPGRYREWAEACTDSLLNSICASGFSMDEMVYSRKRAVSEITAMGIEPGISNRELAARCMDAYLYNRDLAAGSALADIFVRKTEFDEGDLTRLNQFASISLRSDGPATLDEGPVAFIDDGILRRNYGQKQKLKIKNESPELVTGGKILTMSNGIRVIYKHTDDKKFSYCLDLRGGAGLVEGISELEYPFVATVLKTCRIGSASSNDFFALLEKEGIRMDISSGWSDLSISGDAAPDKFKSVLNALWAIAYDRQIDRDEFGYRLRCDNIGASRFEISGDFPERVEAYLKGRFSNWSDGVLVIMGPLSEDTVRNELCEFLAGVSVSGRFAAKVPYEKSADSYPLTVRSYLAFRVAEVAIQRTLASTLLPYGMFVETIPSITVSPMERIKMSVRCVPCPQDGLPPHVAPGDSLEVARLVRYTMSSLKEKEFDNSEIDAYKRLVGTRLGSELKNPDVLMGFIKYKYADNRDLVSDYAIRMPGVSASDVRNVIGVLMEGDNLKWVWE